MNVVEFLRNEAESYAKNGFTHDADNLLSIAEDIERCYMELPTDANGVPIRVGDMLTDGGRLCFEVVGVNEKEFFFVDEHIKKNRAKHVIHARKRTIEDVLYKFGNEIAASASEPWRQIVVDYASEIRELMGGGGE